MTAALPPFGDAQVVFRMPLEESSGLAVVGDRVVTLEDSGNPARLTALDRRGRVVDRYRLDVPNTDWEDLAVAPDARGRASLWVADTGDNRARRDQVQVDRVAADGSGPVTRYRFTYADGPHDAEALLVLPGGRRVAVVTKEVLGAGVYTAPLDAAAPQVLTRAADLSLGPTDTPGGPVGAVGSVLVTGGAVAPDGSRFALRTYTDLYEWRLTGDDVAGALRTAPTRTPLPATPQGEAVAYDGLDAVLTSSEEEGSPVHRLTRQRASETQQAPQAPTPRPTAAPAPPAEGGDLFRRVVLGAGAVAALSALVLLLTRRGGRGRRRRQA